MLPRSAHSRCGRGLETSWPGCAAWAPSLPSPQPAPSGARPAATDERISPLARRATVLAHQAVEPHDPAHPPHPASGIVAPDQAAQHAGGGCAVNEHDLVHGSFELPLPRAATPPEGRRPHQPTSRLSRFRHLKLIIVVPGRSIRSSFGALRENHRVTETGFCVEV